MLTVVRHRAVGYSTIVLTLPILPTTNPSNLIFPTPLFPEMDPRTAKAESSSGPLILQLWKIHVTDYGDEAVKNASQKGFYGFVSGSQKFEPSDIADTWRTRRNRATQRHLYSQLRSRLYQSLQQRLPHSLMSPCPYHLRPSSLRR